MAVTPRGIVAPNLPDPYNLVGDLNTLARTADAAIGGVANAHRGASTQRTAFTTTAVNGMLWQDTDGIKMLWRKDGTAWVPAVWRWAGTTAQMNAFTQAPNGFEWFNTSTSARNVRIGGAWHPLRVSGAGVVPSLAAGAAVYSQRVNFPQAFPSTPSLTTAQNSVRVTIAVTALTPTYFEFAAGNWSNAAQATASTLNYVATLNV